MYVFSEDMGWPQLHTPVWLESGEPLDCHSRNNSLKQTETVSLSHEIRHHRAQTHPNTVKTAIQSVKHTLPWEYNAMWTRIRECVSVSYSDHTGWESESESVLTEAQEAHEHQHQDPVQQVSRVTQRAQVPRHIVISIIFIIYETLVLLSVCHVYSAQSCDSCCCCASRDHNLRISWTYGICCSCVYRWYVCSSHDWTRV